MIFQWNLCFQNKKGYLGLNTHYLTSEWKRVKLTLGVEPFNGESHTSENMLRMVLQLLEYYNLLSKTNVGLRDNASAMKAMFNLSDSQMVGLGCLIHSLQLCLEDQLLNLPSVKAWLKNLKRQLNWTISLVSFMLS